MSPERSNFQSNTESPAGLSDNANGDLQVDRPLPKESTTQGKPTSEEYYSPTDDLDFDHTPRRSSRRLKAKKEKAKKLLADEQDNGLRGKSNQGPSPMMPSTRGVARTKKWLEQVGSAKKKKRGMVTEDKSQKDNTGQSKDSGEGKANEIPESTARMPATDTCVGNGDNIALTRSTVSSPPPQPATPKNTIDLTRPTFSSPPTPETPTPKKTIAPTSSKDQAPKHSGYGVELALKRAEYRDLVEKKSAAERQLREIDKQLETLQEEIAELEKKDRMAASKCCVYEE